MPIVNIICQICFEIYNNSAEVVSTMCGHLFHNHCLNDWLRRENSCPQCRKPNPNRFKIQLGFTQQEEEPLKLEDIQVQIKSSEEKVAELLLQNQELNDNLHKLQEQHTLTASVNTDLEEKLSMMNNFEVDFLRLQADYTEISEIQKQFEDHVNQSFIENECKTKVLEKRTRESQIASNLSAQNVALHDNALGEEIKSLEMKVQIVRRELEKEIQQTALLSADNLKLQSRINELQSVENKENQVSKRRRSRQKNRKADTKPFRKNSPQNLNKYDNSVVIKGLALSQLNDTLENVVLNLATKMKLILYSHDVLKVEVMKADIENSNCATISVQFKDNGTKIAFLANREILQNDSESKSISIEEFMRDELRQLFIYTKKKLHNRGLIHFYIENNQLFAKKNRMDPDRIHIQNKEQVDNIAHIYDCKKAVRC